ncbi:hypothetical protein [Streptomyces sp. A1136]|uniref:hypothetical protein n=1 Tax=Streptomyces sp. A1136 TaxID=2563102 RepID=UPI00144722DF|nr:hypothetical protein [Streptomyces sp. A1136]
MNSPKVCTRRAGKHIEDLIPSVERERRSGFLLDADLPRYHPAVEEQHAAAC